MPVPPAVRLRFGALLLLGPLGLLTPALTAQDVEGSADHSLVSRFPGSTIVRYRSAVFDDYRLVDEPINGYRGGMRAVPDREAIDGENSTTLEGRSTLITYEAPANSSSLQIFRSYENALGSAGFQTVFQCAGLECAGDRPPPECSLCGDWENAFGQALMHRAGITVSGDIHQEQRYLAARLSRPEGDVWVALLVLGLEKPLAQLDVVEVEPLEEGLVTVDAAAMAREIDTSGSVALYGIHFATGSAEIQPESEPTLQEIGRLLEEQPDLELFVVGHTDNTGTFETNRVLSDERARAVVDALVSRQGVTAARLTAYGVGPLAPVAPNESEEGRAQNRRVELVRR